MYVCIYIYICMYIYIYIYISKSTIPYISFDPILQTLTQKLGYRYMCRMSATPSKLGNKAIHSPFEIKRQ